MYFNLSVLIFYCPHFKSRIRLCFVHLDGGIQIFKERETISNDCAIIPWFTIQ